MDHEYSSDVGPRSTHDRSDKPKQAARVNTAPTDDTPLTVAIACGGTGGHFYPGLTIARELRRRGGQAVLFIAGKHIDDQVAIARADDIAAVPAKAVRIPAQRLRLPLFAFQFAFCIHTNRSMMRRRHIDTVLGMGSFASAPIVLAGESLRLPTFVHEGNAVLGRANRLLSRRARATLTSFPHVHRASGAACIRVTGMPIREAIVDAGNTTVTAARRSSICRDLQLDPDQPILLVFGGSQGAQFINTVMREMMSDHAADLPRFQFIHITGQSENTTLSELYQSHGVRHVVLQNDPKIEALYMVADFVICRSGASTLFELAHMGKPALFIPYPAATDNHQVRNAEYLVSHNAAYLVEERDCTPAGLQEIILRWLEHPEAARNVGRAAKALALPNATGAIVDILVDAVRKGV